MARSSWLSALVLFVLCSCGKELPTLENINLEEWKTDRNGCLNKRLAMTEQIALQKDELLALNEKQVIKLLGKPDRNELYKRNQKFYHYFLSPSPDCGADSVKISKLVIRFNAMGLAKEVGFE